MKERYPTLCPVFQVAPSLHLYQLLEEGTVDAVMAFQELEQKKSLGIYKELAQLRVVAVVPKEHPLAKREILDREVLQNEKLILTDPQRAPSSFYTMQHKLLEGKLASNVLLCDSADACMVLAHAGLGIGILADLPILREPSLSYIPIQNMDLLSYGVYYKSAAGKPLLKLFLQLCKKLSFCKRE